MAPKYIRGPARETPVLLDTDVLIAGEGPAGILATISASKKGVRTALLEESSFLGGTAAIGLGMPINNTAPGGIEHGGVTSDFNRLLCQPGPDQALVNETRIWGKHIWHDPELLKTKVLQFLVECGVKVTLNARVVGGIVEGSIARGLIFETKGGRQTILRPI
jgi:ribulose 1,5-bisphosphate synthetase/thiazole synthase